ncbi:BtrH N-terminal domain-containing protein [Saccharopolyspora sp. NPDC049426]|uniref:BtrH N-terminal domain-containing protein n=1 Tax=unclassified Saccharopolyspora TaxID=2646250 RepID=UPI00324D78FC
MTGRHIISDYPHQVAGHCGSGALRDLMHWAQLSYDETPLDEGTVFGLGGELGFTYLRHPAMRPPIYLVGRGPDLTGGFTRRLGITATQHATDDPDEGWAWVREELDHGYPVLCWADIAHLPYLRVRLSMSRHDIVITGYDDHTRTATVIDNDRADPQPVPYDALARARSSTGFPAPTRHTGYRLRYPTHLPPLANTAADACHAAARGLRNPQSLVPASQLDGVTDCPYGAGLDGLSVFVDDLRRWPDVFTPTQLDTVLTALAAFIDKAGTGGSLFRRLQADYLHYLAHRTGLPIAGQAADLYDQLTQLWHDLARIATTDTSTTTRVTALADTAEHLPELEQQGADLLDLLARELSPDAPENL